MHSLNLDQELILTIEMSELPKLKKFLKTLAVSEESGESVDFILEHKDGLEHINNIETNDGEHIIIVGSASKIHIFLKKNAKFEQIKEKWFAHFTFK